METEQNEAVRLPRLLLAYQKFQDKTFDEEFAFEDFASQFRSDESDLASSQRQYLFDLYGELVSMTRSANQEEFNDILQQLDVSSKLNRLDKLLLEQPAGSCGVPISDVRPSVAMRALSSRMKAKECEHLRSWLSRLERENEELRPQLEKKQQDVMQAVASLRQHRQAWESMVSASPMQS